MLRQHAYSYLRIVSDRYKLCYFSHDFENALQSMTEEHRRDLIEAKNSIVLNKHAEPISRWIDWCKKNESELPLDEFEFSLSVGRILVFLHFLAERKIEPFFVNPVGYVEMILEPNWDNVPENLVYLANFAKRFKSRLNNPDGSDFLSNATSDEMELLAGIAERFRVNCHKPVLESWLDEYFVDEHPEGWIMYCLLGLMDNAGFDVDPIS